MSQQYVGDLSALHWTFDHNLRLWCYYDTTSGRFMYCDDHGHVWPHGSTFQNASGHTPVYYSPWNQQPHRLGPIHMNDVQSRAVTSELYAVRPATHAWHTVTGQGSSNGPVPNISFGNVVGSRPVGKEDSDGLPIHGLASMSLNENAKHSGGAGNVASISQSQHAEHLPYSDFSNESASSSFQRLLQPNEDELLRRGIARHV